MKRLLSKAQALLGSSGPAATGWVFFGALLGLNTLLRFFLLFFRWGDVPHGAAILLHVFWTGLLFDALMCGLMAFPAATVAGLAPERFLSSRAGRALAASAYFFFLALFIFLAAMEIGFFDEFDARFNYIAVDYLLFPTEVGENIWQSYPLIKILLAVGAGAGVVFAATRSSLQRALASRAPWRRRTASLGVYAAVLAGLFSLLSLETSRISENRLVNEIAGNGYYDFFYSLWSNDLDYDQYYVTMDRSRAVALVRDSVREAEEGGPGAAGNPLQRRLKEDGDLHAPNVVIILGESFGAKFTGVLRHHPENLTPRFDKLAGEGLLFTDFYATGSRTVRALEAVLCSFPPVPGMSVVKRPKYEGFFTLADVFKTNGYDTLFVYGGRGIFDHMKPFMLENGFDRFIEQKDYARPVFTSAWGVSDEDIFGKAVDEFDALDRAGKRFFGAVLTVSNHKPYTYPPGRIDLDPGQHRRENAVKYADWALGDFFERAKKRPFFNKTVFAFLGDHGARVYGADFIPIDSYEVPFLIYAPGRVKPGAVDTLACSMDVAPTLLGLTDLSYETTFFGRDLFDVPPERGYALMQHDRDVSLLKGDRLAVLGVSKRESLYRFDRATRRFTPILHPDAEGSDLLRTAAAFYQTAYGLYRDRTYRLSEVPVLPAAASVPVEKRKPPVAAVLP